MILLLLACGQTAEPPQPPEPAELHLSPEAEAAAQTAGQTAGEPQRYASRHLLISHDEVAEPRDGAPSREEARALAESLLARIRAGEDMAVLAATYSDDQGSKHRGGYLGEVEPGTWVPEFEAAALSIDVDEVTLAESAYGFHVIQRESMASIHLRHIVVQFQGNYPIDRDALQQATRSREAALARAEAAVAALESEPFEAVCARFSDGPMALRAGDLGWYYRGELGPDFDDVAFALKAGEHSAIVETPFGFHILERVE